MALHVPRAPGFSQMLKDGAKHFSGLEEAVYRNIQACKEFSETVRTAYGPRGMNKIIINHIEKLFVTSDAATIVKELEVQHPAAKMLVLGSQMQEQETGDGTSFVIIMAGALLEAAEHMLRMGLKPTEVITGYEMALTRCIELLPSLVVKTVDLSSDENIKSAASVVIKPSIMSKQYGIHDFLTKLLTEACVCVYDNKSTFNVDNIRVCKVLGGGVLSSQVVEGMVFRRETEGVVNSADNAKIAVFTCPIDIATTETKGTVLIKSAEELKNFSRGEETQLECQIKAIADTGAKVIVAGGKFGDMALHYINKYNLMAVRLSSKFDVRRLCRLVGATALPRLTAPSAAELGHCHRVYVDELAATTVVVFTQNDTAAAAAGSSDVCDARVATVIVRGSADNIMDDLERAVDDGVNAFKLATKDGRMLAGGGACELQLASLVSQYADTCVGVEQYAVKQFASALETFPKLLAENCGANATAVLAEMYAAHQNKDGAKIGFNVDAMDSVDNENVLIDCAEKQILDLYLNKYWALKYAVQAACTVLRVDEIIMAKRSGGPKPRDNPNWDED